MKQILCIAKREFMATITTKAFIIGILITPLAIGMMAVVMPRMMKRTAPKVVGEFAIIDPTGQVTEGLRGYLLPEKFVQRLEKRKKDAAEATPKAVKSLIDTSPQGQAAMQEQLEKAFGEAPQITVVQLDAGTDPEKAKSPLKSPASGEDKSQLKRLALIVVHPDAVQRAEGKGKFGSYDLFIRSKVDDRLEDDIHDGLRDSIIAARIRNAGMNEKEIEAITSVKLPKSKTVTADGEGTTNEVFNVMLPAAFMILLLISSLTSSQSLLTTTVEEKSNRVVEVLLSAVSPFELLTGKILGQMAIGLLVLVLYSSLGIVALISFAMAGLLDPMLLLFLVIFFIIAYFTFAAFMAAVGSAVNEIREAQALMTPVMLMLMIPWMLWMPISREPNSVLSTVLSFVPGIGTFVMMLRMASNSPPPMWQVGLTIVICSAGAAAAVWAASKVFRIGLLMFGKPPTFGTLIRWIRMS
jgi:ABC-2 type transport system permease protein